MLPAARHIRPAHGRPTVWNRRCETEFQFSNDDCLRSTETIPGTTNRLDILRAQGWEVDVRESRHLGGNYFDLPPEWCYLVWDKQCLVPNYAAAELAWTNLDKPVQMFRWEWDGCRKQEPEQRIHPTQKPLAVIKWAIAQAPDVRSVLDPYMGSGTTLRAAKDMGLTAVGIEREERYCEIAARPAQPGSAGVRLMARSVPC